MDGTLTHATLKIFSEPRQWLGSLNAELAALVVAAASDLAVIVDQAGVVADVSHSQDLRVLAPADRWTGLPFTACVTQESVPKIEALLREARERGLSGWRQVNHSVAAGDDVPVLYSCVSLGHGDLVMFLGRDLRSTATLQQRLLQSQQAMEREYARMRQGETRYRLPFQLSSEAVLICEASKLRIVEVNPAATELLGASHRKLVGRTFPEGFDNEGNAQVEAMLSIVRAAGRAEPVVVALEDGVRRATVSASLFRLEHTPHLLVRISTPHGAQTAHDLELQRQSILLQQLPDCFVVTDADGLIHSANPAFLELVEVASADLVRGEELGRWLGKPGVDFPVLMNYLRENGTVRLFQSVLRSNNGAFNDVEVSATSATVRNEQWVAFSIRAVQQMRDRPARNVQLPRAFEQLNELIGRVPLKDLVRETTDLIERMCIESALMLTGDNRASAAELLGLSRQSLYVKLHRFGLGDLSTSSEGNTDK